MIKYYCDFCETEIPDVKLRYEEEAELKVKVNSGNTTKIINIEHICKKCNDEIITDFKERGIEVL